jgi:hypothetical protein
MKKATMNFVLALITLTLGFSTVTLANDEDRNNNITELKFIGNIENKPVFQLNLKNDGNDEIAVIFRDEAGNVLYSAKFKGANITKKFMLKTDDFGGDVQVSVVVKSKLNNSTEVYSINRNHSYVDETVVNKVK